LIENFPEFMKVLESFTNDDGLEIDYHVGITTTGVTKNVQIGISAAMVTGEDGRLQTGADCGMNRGWLERGDTGVVDSFSCSAKVGINGSGTEMPLEAARLALTDRTADGSNTGFLREEALLALVVLTDEDDCSVQGPTLSMGLFDTTCTGGDAVSTYVSAMDEVKGDRSLWATAIIAGPANQSCKSA